MPPTAQPIAPPTPAGARPLSPRQAEMFAFFRDRIRADGFAPTYDEAADALGVTKVTVFEHVKLLEAKGWIRRTKHAGRSVELCELCPCCGQPVIGGVRERAE